MRKLPGAVELSMRNPTILDSVAVYRARFAGASPVDPLRRILAAGSKYHWRGLVSPDTNNQLVPARGTFSDQFTVAPGSLITMITGYSVQPEGFQVQITDKGSKQTLANVPVSFLAGVGGANASSYYPNRPLPLILSDLWPVSKPGLLLVTIVNLSVNANQLGLCIHVAERSS
jgi:hypothetical protein